MKLSTQPFSGAMSSSGEVELPEGNGKGDESDASSASARRHKTPFLRIGVVMQPSSAASSFCAWVATAGEASGWWQAEYVTGSSMQLEQARPTPSSWDALLVSLKSGKEIRAAVERLGVSGPVILAITRQTLFDDWGSGISALDEVDDFLFETADPIEAILRVQKAVQRRRKQHILWAGKVRLNLLTRRVCIDGEFFPRRGHLTISEMLALAMLIEEPNRTVPQAEYLDMLGTPHEHTITNIAVKHFSALRKKLGVWWKSVKNVPGAGYRLDPLAERATPKSTRTRADNGRERTRDTPGCAQAVDRSPTDSPAQTMK